MTSCRRRLGRWLLPEKMAAVDIDMPVEPESQIRSQDDLDRYGSFIVVGVQYILGKRQTEPSRGFV